MAASSTRSAAYTSPLQLAVENHHRHLHFALDPALLGQGQHGAFAFFGDDLAVDAAFDVQPAAEDQIAVDRDLRADQRIDGMTVVMDRLVLEHVGLRWQLKNRGTYR